MSNSYYITELHKPPRQAMSMRSLVWWRGDELNAKDEHGNTPLKYASAEPFPRAMRKLIELRGESEPGRPTGLYPLDCAAGHGFYEEAPEMVELLLEHGADVNAQSNESVSSRCMKQPEPT